MFNWLTTGAVLAALGVGLGAFGAHALPGWLASQERDPEVIVRDREIYETAVRYHLVHAVALVLVGLAMRGLRPDLAEPATTAWNVAGGLLLAGLLLFSGSLYALVLTNLRWLGAITPLGGVALIAGWLALAWAASTPR